MSNATQNLASIRINSLLDTNSFVEIGQGITARSTDFNLTADKTPSDGVITGYGVVNGSLVYVYSQDVSVLNGTIGEMHAKKITHLYDLAMKTGAPVIGLLDCGGVRLQEATDALHALGEVFFKQSMASGVIPQITGVFGNCGGGLSLIPALTDFTFLAEEKGKLFVNSPNAIPGNEISRCDTSSATFQSEETGLVDYVGSEADVLAQMRNLIAMLPSNNEDDAVGFECTDELNRTCPELLNCTTDTAIALAQIADNQDFFETKSCFAKDMVTGFLRLNGMIVGAIANRSEVYDGNGEKTEAFDGTLSARGARKARAMVQFCDAFSIPLLTLTSVNGFKATICSERNAAREIGAMVHAFAQATVPKVNVVVGQAYGGAAVAMNSKALGADMVFAWPNAQIGTMDAGMAAKIMYADADATTLKEKADAYAALQSNVQSAAQRGYVDTVIEAADTRKYVIGAFEMLFTKREDRPVKKHGSV